MDDIVFSVTVNILRNKFKLYNFKWLYCSLSTDKGNPVVLSLPYCDVSTEQATEEMLFDFESKSSEISPHKSNLHIDIILSTIIGEDRQ